VAGALYFLLVYAPAERAQAIEAWQARLNAMADDRRAAIGNWVASGASDASTVAAFPTVVAAMAAQAGRPAVVPGVSAIQGHLKAVIDGFGRAHRRRALVIVDPVGAMVVEDLAGSATGKECAAVVRRADTRDGRPAVLGFAIVVADPTVWLYPLLAREPLPTASGEALLARKDDEDIVFVSPLRHRAARPLSFRVSAKMSPLAARAAVEGWESFGKYVDYRGVPVFAAARSVPGTRWGLVAKIDEDEALAVYRDKIRSSALTMAGFALALVGTGFGLWRARRARYEAALSRSQARFALLLDHANDAILFVGTDGQILDANRKAETLYGYAREELLRLTMRDLRAEEARGPLQDQLVTTASSSGHLLRSTHLRRDGSTFPVEVSSRIAELDEGRAVLSIVRDLSEREAAEERIRFLNRLLRAVTEINELMVRERDISRMLAQACRIAVEHGRFRMAWVGMANFETGEVRPVASAGFEEGYLDEVRFRCDDSPEGRGPTGTAICGGQRLGHRRERRPLARCGPEAVLPVQRGLSDRRGGSGPRGLFGVLRGAGCLRAGDRGPARRARPGSRVCAPGCGGRPTAGPRGERPPRERGTLPHTHREVGRPPGGARS
jgi:PAS domain S-box-containing protein